MKAFNSMSQLRQANKRNGFFFFAKNTMKMFNSRIESKLYKNGCFITSETTNVLSGNDKRQYCVRQVKNALGAITTIQSFIDGIGNARSIAKAQADCGVNL